MVEWHGEQESSSTGYKAGQHAEGHTRMDATKSPRDDPNHGWILVGKSLVVLYNVATLFFMTAFPVDLALDLLVERRGSFPSRRIEWFVVVAYMPVHFLAIAGNWTILFLVPWLLGRQRPGMSYLRRIGSTLLLFVPVWGLRHYRRLFIESESSAFQLQFSLRGILVFVTSLAFSLGMMRFGLADASSSGATAVFLRASAFVVGASCLGAALAFPVGFVAGAKRGAVVAAGLGSTLLFLAALAALRVPF